MLLLAVLWFQEQSSEEGRKEDAGEEAAAGLGAQRRGQSTGRRHPEKVFVLLEYQDIPDFRMRPDVGTGHRGSIPGTYTRTHELRGGLC